MLKQIEDYVKSLAGNTEPAHKFDHFDRSRKWGLRIAKQEGYPDLEAVEIACLLHDIGLVDGRKGHGAKDFDKLFDAGKVKWESLLDILNFQNSCYENLKTDAAKKLAKKWADYSKRFLKDLQVQLLVSQ